MALTNMSCMQSALQGVELAKRTQPTGQIPMPMLLSTIMQCTPLFGQDYTITECTAIADGDCWSLTVKNKTPQPNTDIVHYRFKPKVVTIPFHEASISK